MPAKPVLVAAPRTGFKGMRLITNTRDWDHDYLYYAKNAFPSGDGAYEPVVSPFNTNGPAALAQAFGSFIKADGTVVTWLVASGQIYTLSGQAWSVAVTSANLATASITLNSTGHVWGTAFSRVLIVTDGTNTPFQWDGTAGAGGLTSLTAAPVAFGPAAVYFAKVFFVQNTARDTIVWSEEGDATTGYSGTSVWQLRQTGKGTVHRLLGTNDALYYFRRDSIGSIRGAVTTDFTASGTHDNVSDGYGTTSPKSVAYRGGYVWFVDERGRPCRFAPGGAIEEIWRNIDAFYPVPELQSTGNRGVEQLPEDITHSRVGYLPRYNAMVFGLQARGAGSLAVSALWSFDAGSGVALCELAVSGVTHVVELGNAIVSVPSGDGYVDTLGAFVSTSGGSINCQFYDISLGFFQTHSYVAGPMAGTSLYSQWRRLRAVLGIPAMNTPSTVTVSAVLTSSVGIGGQDAGLSAVGVISSLSTAPGEAVLTWGIKRRSRWMQPGLHMSGGAAAGVSLQLLELEGFEDVTHPSRRS